MVIASDFAEATTQAIETPAATDLLCGIFRHLNGQRICGQKPSVVDKTKLLEALLAQLQTEWDLQVRAANLARDEATNEESRAENKYDTRGQEAAYLAQGQAKLATEISESITLFRGLNLDSKRSHAIIEIGSVVKIERPGGVIHGFMGPRSGGTEFLFEAKLFTVITPASPLGRALLGRRLGDTVYLTARGKPQAHRIVGVS